MADNFNVDFSLLGQLPAVAGAAQDRATLKATLADLKSGDPDSLIAAGAKLLAAGNAAEGIKLITTGQQGKAIIQKGLLDKANLDYWQRTFGPDAKKPPADNPAAAGDVTIVPPGAPAAAPPAQLPSQSPPVAFPPPPPTGQQGALPAPPIQQVGPGPSPSDAMIGAAQQAMAPPQEAIPPQLAGPPPGQLAGPPPTPDTAQPGLSPATIQGAQFKPAPALPQAQAAPTAPLPGPQSQAEAQIKAIKVGGQLMEIPPGGTKTPAFQKFMAEYRNALAQQRLSPEMESYRLAQVQSIAAGHGDISYDDWKSDIQSGPAKYKEALKDYGEHKDTGNKAQAVLNNITRIDQITKDPNFVSGAYANKYADVINKMASVAQISGIANWTPQSVVDKVRAAATPALKAAALRDEFVSLTNQAVLANAGSFSKGFSEGDRTFTERIFQTIGATPGGIESISKNLKAIAEHNLALSKVATEYMADTDKGSKSTPFGLQKAIQKYNDEHPLFVEKGGKLTPDGQELQKKMDAITVRPGGTTAPDAPAATPSAARKITAEDEGKIFDVGGKLFIIRNGKREPYS